MPAIWPYTEIQWTPEVQPAELVREINDRFRSLEEFMAGTILAIDAQFDLLEALVLTRTGEFSYRNNQETILGTFFATARVGRIGLLAPDTTPNVTQLRIGSNTSPVTSPPIVGAVLSTSYQFFDVTSGGEFVPGDTVGLTLAGGSNNSEFSAVLTLALDNQPFD